MTFGVEKSGMVWLPDVEINGTFVEECIDLDLHYITRWLKIFVDAITRFD